MHWSTEYGWSWLVTYITR